MVRMQEKNVALRNFLLDRVESGQWPSGAKLPGARQLAVEAQCSFTYMQSVIESLVQQGVFVSISRSGTYVCEHWRRRLLPDTIRLFLSQSRDRSRTGREFVSSLRSRFPDLRIVTGFERAAFEFRVSYDLLQNHRDYLDLAPYFRKCFPDSSQFCEEAFAPYRFGGELCGLPIRFSPRVVVFNRRIFAECGCPEPRPEWSWEEFLECIRNLRRRLPSEAVLPYPSRLFDFFAIISRFGGCFLDPSERDPVKIDSPATVRAVEEYCRLLEILGPPKFRLDGNGPPPEALLILTRQEITQLFPDEDGSAFGAVPLPLPENGRRINVYGVELLCVRNECTDSRRIEQMVSFLLSPSFQNQFGRNRDGIPVRRSSAKMSLAGDGPFDALFRRETGCPAANYHLYSPELCRLAGNAIELLTVTPRKEVRAFLRSWADAFRFLLRCDGLHR